MIAYALHYGVCAGIAHGKPFAGHSVDIGFSCGGAIERHIADDDVVVRAEGAGFRGGYNQFSAGEPFTEVIVAVARKAQGEPPGDKRTEGIARRRRGSQR